MNKNIFSDCASNSNHPNWQQHIHREHELYGRDQDIRSDYERDYNRILHSLAYRRLKHKTQVFFNIDNDHICTRMEHVQHVESVSCSIAQFLGLNVELTRAIAMGHDLGHAPFGHEGEVELTNIRKEWGMDKFWHERNSLRIIDKVDLLEDTNRDYQNLNLTYAVRDGIICHCGEVDENGIIPRKEAIDLNAINTPGECQAYTWEGCVVKISDKIAYLGRDIEDAYRMNFISKKDVADLLKISGKYGENTINTTVIIHNFITSICENSTPERGIRLSDIHNDMLKEIKDFNYRAIYLNKKFSVYRNYVKLVIRSIYDALMDNYDGENSIRRLRKLMNVYPKLASDFISHLEMYSELTDQPQCKNEKIYGCLENEKIYVQAIIDYISGMTDRYAIEIFNELLKY